MPNPFTTGPVPFRSSNAVVFEMENWRLEFMLKGFPPVSFNSNEAIVLTENAKTLGLLFAFLDPHRSIPDINALSFPELLDFHNAAIIDVARPFKQETHLNAGLQEFGASSPASETMELAGTWHNHSSLLAAVAPYAVSMESEELRKIGFVKKICAKSCTAQNGSISSLQAMASSEVMTIAALGRTIFIDIYIDTN
ncbi:hypothetical protein F5880DRAFT_1618228 [Lentinula raphanica]|nr:hypothetical protein F5880DRAFT_1618228 [Lentinula raphanica]